jgi:uncharacterized membrane protein
MKKGRLEAFSDGVLAIILTIMVLEMKIPHGQDLQSLKPLFPVFISYLLSFIYIGIYWNNHHHLLTTVEHVSGGILWANLHLLFWLSMVPFVTGWMGENHFAADPVALYGVVLLMCGIAYWTLQKVIIRQQGKNSLLAEALGNDLKGKISPICYLVAVPFAYVSGWISAAIYTAVALVWLIPDQRIERTLNKKEDHTEK